MKTDFVEWRVLRGALAGLATTAVLCGALVVGSDRYVEQLQTENTGQQHTLDQIRARYNAAVEERNLIRRYLPEYRALQQSGFIGEENRLSWVDVLHELAIKHRVLQLTYDIKPRTPANGNAEETQSGPQLLGSEMNLQLELLHEGNLLGFLHELEQRRIGLFNIRSCAVQRNRDDVALENPTATVTARCTLVWHTLLAEAATP